MSWNYIVENLGGHEISNLRNWAAPDGRGPGTDSGTGLYLQDTANYFAGTSAGASIYETAAVEFAGGHGRAGCDGG